MFFFPFLFVFCVTRMILGPHLATLMAIWIVLMLIEDGMRRWNDVKLRLDAQDFFIISKSKRDIQVKLQKGLLSLTWAPSKQLATPSLVIPNPFGMFLFSFFFFYQRLYRPRKKHEYTLRSDKTQRVRRQAQRKKKRDHHYSLTRSLSQSRDAWGRSGLYLNPNPRVKNKRKMGGGAC